MAGPGPAHRGPGSPGAAGGVEGAGPHRGAARAGGEGGGGGLQAGCGVTGPRRGGGRQDPGEPEPVAGGGAPREPPRGGVSDASPALSRRRGNHARHRPPVPLVGPAPTVDVTAGVRSNWARRASRKWGGGGRAVRARPARCPLLTSLGVGYADHAVLAHVLPQPALRGSPWCPFHAAAFNLIVLLLLACHMRAVLADPGVVPLPDTAIDFSDLRTGAPRKPERGQEDWTVCDRCEAYRPPHAHHCRVCHRCVRRMDHHCPWINNCVGELNQKYFIQFLFYTGLASLYAAGLVLAAWLGPAGRSPAGMAVGGDVANSRVQTAHCIVLLLESLLFGAFVAIVFYDQVMSIITDETPLEQLRNRGLKETNGEGPRPPKPKLALLREVFGRGFVLCWLFPWSCSPTPGTGLAYSPLPSCYV